MNKKAAQEAREYFDKIKSEGINLLPGILTDEEWTVMLPFFKVIQLRNYIISCKLDELAAGGRRRLEHYQQLSDEFNLKIETLKKITYNQIIKETVSRYKAGESLRKIAKTRKISYGRASEVIKKKGLTRDPHKPRERKPYRESWIITEADIEEDFKTRIFK